MLEIQRTGPVPLFQQIRDWMQEQITSGHWPEHYKLKAEIDLAAELGVNRGTMRKAIEQLISEGSLLRIHGRGTFVASREIAQPLADRLVTFSEDLIGKGIHFDTLVIDQSINQPDEQVASLLAIPTGARVFALNRVRLVQDKPIAWLKNYIRYDLCPGIEKIDFTEHRLFETLEGRYKLPLGWGQRSFEARLADEQTAQALAIEPNAPVMYLEQVVYLRDNTPVEFSEVWFRGDGFRLSAVVRRVQEYWAPSSSRETLNITVPTESAGADDN